MHEPLYNKVQPNGHFVHLITEVSVTKSIKDLHYEQPDGHGAH